MIILFIFRRKKDYDLDLEDLLDLSYFYVEDVEAVFNKGADLLRS